LKRILTALHPTSEHQCTTRNSLIPIRSHFCWHTSGLINIYDALSSVFYQKYFGIIRIISIQNKKKERNASQEELELPPPPPIGMKKKKKDALSAHLRGLFAAT